MLYTIYISIVFYKHYFRLKPLSVALSLCVTAPLGVVTYQISSMSDIYIASQLAKF